MKVALLNLISTPAAVLPREGLELHIGLSSEDPMVGRHSSEPYGVYLSVYAPDGAFVKRLSLGRIPPHRRQEYDVSALVKPFGFDDNHLVVIHRVPASLAHRYGVIDEPVALPGELDYGFFRSYVQYAYPGARGAHGGVIYEMSSQFNEHVPGKQPSVVLTFTTKIVLSDAVETSVVLINGSTDPHYATTACYAYAIHAGDGARLVTGECPVRPFTVGVLQMRDLIPAHAIEEARDPTDGLSHFCFYGICENAALAILILNLTPSQGGVSVEHTHPTQGYLLSSTADDRQRIKQDAVAGWHSLMMSAREDHAHRA